MYVLLDTSTPVCKLTIIDEENRYEYQWLAERQMAAGLLKYIEECLEKHGASISKVSGWSVFAGPGSFTVLRIGSATVNTICYFLKKPIISAKGDNWQNESIDKLRRGEDDKIVIPYYGRPARITLPRK